ncbi:MAG: ROK family protein [Clostridia bacterium]|nr:ROK family protein [Oscillospiraceae bacterium]MBO4933430.1 ROK family protein [Clostridia bacterium]
MYYIGVDLGGTNIAIGIVNEDFEIVKKGSTPTKPERGADAIVEDMAALSRKLIAEMGITMDDIASAGVATPGTANNETGVVEYANNIPFLQYPLADKLSALLDGKPVYIENDANAAAKAEAMAGVAKGAPYSVMITLGTGLGGGIVINGKVYSGFNFAGAELGHIVIEKGGRQCSCGRKGCWEAYSSATGLVNMTKDAILAARESGRETMMEEMIGGDLDKVSARTAFNAQKAGDALGAEVVDEYISYLATGIVNVINIFQPNVLSIGGGVCNEGDNLMKPLLEKVWSETYSREGTPQTQILIAKLGNDAGIIGAAVLGQ